MAKPIFLSLALCSLLLLHSCAARKPYQKQQQQQQQGECQIQQLNAREPERRIQAEAGYTEFWDWTEDQFRCAGVAAHRNVIQPKGLLLPYYSNSPQLIHIQQGRGILGIVLPGCPETYQSSQQQQGEESQSFQDQHQKIRSFKEGDIIPIPAGVVHWAYNEGDKNVISIVVEDTTNNQNQLDVNPREFFLAGNPQESQGQQQKEQRIGGNIFKGFILRTVVEMFGVKEETARSVQGQSGKAKGHIVKVERGLEVIRAPRAQEVQEQEQEQERGQKRGERGQGGSGNGFEETICSARLIENINKPAGADIFNPRAGRLTTLNSYNLPILSFLQLSAEKGVLYRNALMVPHWVVNANSILYVTRGEARIQIIDHRGQAVFNDRIQQGQMLVVPQNFVVAKQAGNQGFEWVAFKTCDNAIISTLAGRISALNAIPVDVLSIGYQIPKEEASKLKTNRPEALFVEGSSSGPERWSIA